MIDIRTEEILPLKQVPAYLESRGYGRRVHVAVVYRWVLSGASGVRLETVRIGGLLVTSPAAIQRWVQAVTAASESSHGGRRGSTPPQLDAAAARRARTDRNLREHRILPTEIDEALAGLVRHDASSRRHVGNTLFRNGLRSLAQLRSWGLPRLLDLPRMGARSEAVVRELWSLVASGESASGDS